MKTSFFSQLIREKGVWQGLKPCNKVLEGGDFSIGSVSYLGNFHRSMGDWEIAWNKSFVNNVGSGAAH